MEKIVFTNGCFDIIHPGHIDLLTRARKLGSKLIVGINSDESVRKIKGAARPFIDQDSRREVLLGLKAVDEVMVFDEPTPENLIKKINPNILVKGGDWKISEIIGADYVLKNGGEVFSLPLKGSFSTTGIAEKIKGENQIVGKKTKTAKNLSEDEAIIQDTLKKRSEVFAWIAENYVAEIKVCADLIFQILQSGNKILFCADDESVKTAQYSTEELSGYFKEDHTEFPLIVLAAYAPEVSEPGNNSGNIFSSQIEVLAVEGDLLVAVSASEVAADVVAAVMKAREKGCKVLVMTGAKGKKLTSLSDACIMIPSEKTEYIRETHIAICRIWRDLIDKKVI